MLLQLYTMLAVYCVLCFADLSLVSCDMHSGFFCHLPFCPKYLLLHELILEVDLRHLFPNKQTCRLVVERGACSVALEHWPWTAAKCLLHAGV